MHYRVDIEYALDVMAPCDPIRVMWQPLVGIRNFIARRNRTEIVELVERRHELTAGICRSGIVGQESDYGIYLPLIGWGMEQRLGNLFIQTKKEKRVSITEILSCEARASREAQQAAIAQAANDIIKLTNEDGYETNRN